MFKKIFLITILTGAFIFAMSERALAATTCTRDSECTVAGQVCNVNQSLGGCICETKSSTAVPAQKPCALAKAPCKSNSDCKITNETCFENKSTSGCTCLPKSEATGLKACALTVACQGSKGPFGCKSSDPKPGETAFPCENIQAVKYDESVVARCGQMCVSRGLPAERCVASCGPCVQTVTAGCTEAGVCRDLVGPDYENVKSQCLSLCRNQPCTASTKPCPPSGPLAGATVEALKKQAQSALNQAKFGTPVDLINRAIRILMAFIGSISLVLYIYAGFLWMTASGNTEQVGKAKTTMVWTTLGVVMMLISYMVASFIFKSLGV